MAGTGYAYAPSLIVVWPMAGVVSIALTFISGGWNDGDPLSGQAFLGVMHFITPPFGFSMWIADLQYDRRHNVSRSATSVPAGEIASVVGISIFGLVVFAGALTAFAFLVFG
jgi:hypothetical protein